MSSEFDEHLPDDFDADPRIDLSHVRWHAGDDGDVILVGVVHDHPASVYRVQSFIAALEPATVALELPRITLPLYRQYADDGETPPAVGGEMSAAIQAAGDADCVGIDAPSWRFFCRLAARVRREPVERDTARRLFRGVASVCRHAVACRAAASVARWTGRRLDVEAPNRHDCTVSDPPEVQFDSERRQVSRSLSLLRAAESPRPIRIRDEVRETCMAQALAALREDGDVVAVVGIDHLDGLVENLDRARV